MGLKAEIRQLKELDWGSLDIKESGGWPLGLQVISGAFVFALVFGAGFWFLVPGEREALADKKAEERELIRDFRSQVSQLRSLRSMEAEVEALEQQMVNLRGMLPTDTEVPGLLDAISEASAQHHLDEASIRLRSSVEREFYVEQPFDVAVEGTFHQIGGFLAEVAGMSRIVTLHDMTFTPASDVRDGRVSLALLARTYRYRTDDERAAAEAERAKEDEA